MLHTYEIMDDESLNTFKFDLGAMGCDQRFKSCIFLLPLIDPITNQNGL